MTRQLELINGLAANGLMHFTFKDALEVSGHSPTATANALTKLTKQGLVDRITRGHYSIRPVGSLGTSAVSENLATAVGSAFAQRSHRIAYASALSELGLLTHPVRTIYVACTQQVRFHRVSDRPVRIVLEQPATIHVGAEPSGNSWISTPERALLECAIRVDLAGGVERLAEALVHGSRKVSVERIADLADQLGSRGQVALRRLASLSSALGLNMGLTPCTTRPRSAVRLDPSDPYIAWTDRAFNVLWNIEISDLRAAIAN